MTKQEILNILAQKETQVRHLLGRYHILAPPTEQTYIDAFKKHGEGFVRQLAGIVSGSLAGFNGNDTTVIPSHTWGPGGGSSTPEDKPGKFWDIFNSILGIANNISGTFGGGQQGQPMPYGQPGWQPPNQQQPGGGINLGGLKQNTILLILGAAALVVLVLILKK